jgi:ribosome-binding protein aMBF1 (putative translation factor)
MQDEDEPEPMTADELRKCLGVLGWSQRELARRLQKHHSTVRKWARAERMIPQHVAEWLRQACVKSEQF